MSSTNTIASVRPLSPHLRQRIAFAFLTVTLWAIPPMAKADALDDSLVLFVRLLDSNRDGLVSREELSTRQSQAKANDANLQNVQSLQTMTRGFSMMDTNRDGQLSAAEIGSGINMGFANADRNKNGALTLDEAMSGMPLVARNFATIDARAAGSISLSQVRNFIAQSMKSAVASARKP
jgi:EF hand